MGGTTINDSYNMKIKMAGESLYMLNLFLSRNIYTITTISNKKNKKDIFDFWEYYYKFNTPFYQQIDDIFEYYKKLKSNYELNFKELLIVHVKNKDSEEINYIFSKMNEIKRPHFMPVVLFLCDEYNEKNTFKIIPDKLKYPYINENNIYTEAYINDKEYLFESSFIELTYEGEKIMKRLKKILIRVCSYYNDLGDTFFIPEIEKNFVLSDKIYDYNLNICCIGRFGKGKSTCVNCILGEQKSRESKSGTSTTKKINYYQVNNQPIIIYDIPGFENIETTKEALNKIQELNNNKKELKKKIHIFLYIIKSIDERMFADIEYEIIKEISKQKDIIFLYILTHSSIDTNKDEKIDMINLGIIGVLEKHPNNENYEIFSKMQASKENCIFVNFHPENNNPIYGINELFLKLKTSANLVKSYEENNYFFTENFQNLYPYYDNNSFSNCIKQVNKFLDTMIIKYM